jgi:hypothetical protein
MSIPKVIDVKPEPEGPKCPACAAGRYHTEEEWKCHPYRGHGYQKQVGWSHPALEAEATRAAEAKKT